MYREAAFSHLYSHGALDIERVKFLNDTLDRITDPADQAAIPHDRARHGAFPAALDSVCAALAADPPDAGGAARHAAAGAGQIVAVGSMVGHIPPPHQTVWGRATAR